MVSGSTYGTEHASPVLLHFHDAERLCPRLLCCPAALSLVCHDLALAHRTKTAHQLASHNHELVAHRDQLSGVSKWRWYGMQEGMLTWRA